MNDPSPYHGRAQIIHRCQKQGQDHRVKPHQNAARLPETLSQRVKITVTRY
jgi:hypothetical protein